MVILDRIGSGSGIIHPLFGLGIIGSVSGKVPRLGEVNKVIVSSLFGGVGSGIIFFKFGFM